MTIYNKLVRDLIPEIIDSQSAVSIRILNHSEHLKEMKRKLYEEVKEFDESTSRSEALEELADVLELIHATLPFYEATYEQLEEIRLRKKEKRGGFEKGVYLIEVKE